VAKVKPKSKENTSTERDSSQFELVIAEITGDTSILKGKHRVIRGVGRSMKQTLVKDSTRKRKGAWHNTPLQTAVEKDMN
jgi:hypothetical protein